MQVAYGTQDLDGVMASMVDAAQRHPRVLADPPPAVQLVDFADSGVKLDLNFWIADPQLGTGNVRSVVNLELWRLFRANGIEIPFPQRDLRILDGSGAATAARISPARASVSSGSNWQCCAGATSGREARLETSTGEPMAIASAGA